jgi:hypothetical protein
MSLQETIVFSSLSPICEGWTSSMPTQSTLKLSATMGDYPTSGKLCPESDGIKLVSYLLLGIRFVLLRPVAGDHGL